MSHGPLPAPAPAAAALVATADTASRAAVAICSTETPTSCVACWDEQHMQRVVGKVARRLQHLALGAAFAQWQARASTAILAMAVSHCACSHAATPLPASSASAARKHSSDDARGIVSSGALALGGAG